MDQQDQQALFEDDGLLLPGDGVDPSRRAFLRAAGFGVAAATLTGCSRGPVERAIPQLSPEESVVAGRVYWMATTCGGCTAACGVLARCRDGRPIKLEGNPGQAIGQGGLCAVGQSEVLSLYDSLRIDGPLRDGVGADWKTVDGELRELLQQTDASGIRLLTGTLLSPSTRERIGSFLSAHPGARHIEYDSLSASPVAAAHERVLGVRAVPRPRLARARGIASFDADFLGTWISPVEYAADYARRRTPELPEEMSFHVQLEGRFSLTGSVADERVRLAPWETGPALAGLCDALGQLAGVETPAAGRLESAPRRAEIEELARRLWEVRGEAVVLCGSDELGPQTLAVLANHLLGAYGTTLDLERPSRQRLGNDAELASLVDELEGGRVGLLLTAGSNPAYDLPPRAALALAQARAHVHCGGQLDETAELARWVLPTPHFLEAWDDAEPAPGSLSLFQPTVPALRSARTLRATFAAWAGDPRPERELLADYWQREVFPRAGSGVGFESFWRAALHEGFVELPQLPSAAAPATPALGGVLLPMAEAMVREGLGFQLYPTVAIRDGAPAYNPWLQELPDPLTKLTWDNVVTVSPERAAQLGMEDGQIVRIEGGPEGAALELPLLVQPGQHDDLIAVPLGYGRHGTDRFAALGPDWLEGAPTITAGETIGVSAAPFRRLVNGTLRLTGGGAAVVALVATGRVVKLARVQDYHSQRLPEGLAPAGHEVRDAARRAPLSVLRDTPQDVFHGHALPAADLWSADHVGKRSWGMVVDLGRCTGCSACVIACQAENNIPVVGRDEVQRHREMHWLRIDRYFDGEGDDVSAIHQPMMCQHCDNAPCEGVCPVLATLHSSEGLNQQVYNRCVGTRYCANTCPYKVRRFNWFDYPHGGEMEEHVLNPDVTVRSRGVMEKCSFCVQRIQEAKAEAAREGRELSGSDVQVACQQSCPTRAIRFGDVMESGAALPAAEEGPRAYRVLDELNVKPSVVYLARIDNRTAEDEHAH